MATKEALLTEINDARESAAFWWLGQLGYALKLGGTTVYLDAYLTAHKTRQVPPLLEPDRITNADIVIGTHDHADHIDRPAWKAIAKASPQAVFVCSRLHAEGLSRDLEISPDRLIGVNEGEGIKIKGVTLRPLASAHERLERDEATGVYPHLGFVLEGGGVRLYHSGDTCVYEGLLTKLRALGPFDACFLPINGRDAVRYLSGCIGNMTYQEAVDLAGELQPRLAVPGHYEMFATNAEDPQRFIDYLRAKWPTVPCWVGPHGEKVTLNA